MDTTDRSREDLPLALLLCEVRKETHQAFYFYFSTNLQSQQEELTEDDVGGQRMKTCLIHPDDFTEPCSAHRCRDENSAVCPAARSWPQINSERLSVKLWMKLLQNIRQNDTLNTLTCLLLCSFKGAGLLPSADRSFSSFLLDIWGWTWCQGRTLRWLMKIR